MVDRSDLLEAQAHTFDCMLGRDPVGRPQLPVRAGGDPRDLRGIPVIARGVGGVSPGTNPAMVAFG